jgi:hypothetical protein
MWGKGGGKKRDCGKKEKRRNKRKRAEKCKDHQGK